MSILDAMKERVLYFDGGYGSLMQSMGLRPGELGDRWNLERPEAIIGIHSDYLTAGCDILKTNTFNTNSFTFPDGEGYTVEMVIEAALKNAREALQRVPSDRERYIALDMGPTGKLLEPLGDLSFDEAYALYQRIVLAGVRNGADLILIETMSDTYEIKAAVLAAKENSHLPVFVTVTLDEQGQLLTGCDIPGVVALLEGLRVDALGMNCGLGPVQMRPLLNQLLSVCSLPIIMNPNAGLPRTDCGSTVYDIDPEVFSEIMEDMINAGVRIAGGCCGTTPEFIRQITARCGYASRPFTAPNHNRTFITSYARSVEIGPDPVIIGERINPTGKKKLKQALQDRNMDYILQEAVKQQHAGAHILDVNVGLPGLNEVEMLTLVMKELQSVTDLPLQLDTSNPEAMERAMRYYNGKPMINSVSGKKETMEAIFPLIQKYGGTVVGLSLDHDGIPDTAQGRLAVAETIYQTAASYGIQPKDIIIDGLAMTISTNASSAKTTLETLRLIRDQLKGHTILGVSNISFGLPARESINSNFFTMAMQNGLSAAIINPNSEAMMRSYYSFRALMGLDDMCGEYIAKYNNAAPAAPTKKTANTMSLQDAIINGLKDAARSATLTALQVQDSLTIINEELIPALNVVGDGFEKKKVFLPQLLMSAEAAKTAFDEIKAFVAAQGTAAKSKGTIVIATVKDDIHDIGKNIVKTLLENYSYTVIDLGRDVPPEVIVDAVLQHHAKLCGLSALMTTTVPNMEATISLLRQKAPDCRIMVGGAVLNQEYANMIGADYYGKDAMAAVRYAEELFGESSSH